MIIFKGQLRILFHKHMNYKSLAAAILIMVTSLTNCGLPEDPAKWSDKQLEKWAQNSEWFNALPAKPASITDKREMATQIWLNPESWKVAFEFLSTHKLEDLQDGKIFLTRQQFAKCSLASRSAWNPDLRTLILPTTNGVAVMEEGKHFNIIG